MYIKESSVKFSSLRKIYAKYIRLMHVIVTVFSLFFSFLRLRLTLMFIIYKSLTDKIFIILYMFVKFLKMSNLKVDKNTYKVY